MKQLQRFAQNFKFDLDELLAYDTIKVVRIKDRHLGALRALFLLGVLLYVFVYVLAYKQSYWDTETPVGLMQLFVLKVGTSAMTELPYCTQFGPSSWPDQLPCAYWDASQANYPTDLYNSLVITTRFTTTYEKFVRSNDSAPCGTPWETQLTTVNSFYVADIENFSIRVAHTVSAQRLYALYGLPQYDPGIGNCSIAMATCSRCLMVMPTSLLACCCELQEFLSLSIVRDALRGFRKLVSADVFGAPPSETLRYVGTVLFVTMNYDNKGTSDGYPFCTFTVERLINTEYKTLQPFPINSTYRMMLNRHSIKVIFTQTGTIVAFDFVVLLVSVFSAIGLVGAANLLVECIMLRVLRSRALYKQYKIEEIDFAKAARERRAAQKLQQDENDAVTLKELQSQSAPTSTKAEAASNSDQDRDTRAEIVQMQDIRVSRADTSSD